MTAESPFASCSAAFLLLIGYTANISTTDASIDPAKVQITVLYDAFGQASAMGADLPSGFYRKDPYLPPEQRYYNGAPPEVMRFGAAWPGVNFQLIDKDTEIAPNIHLITLVSDKPGTLELRELSLAISTPDGMVVVVGCSHPGIDKIVESAAAINPRIRFIVGGFHLVVASDSGHREGRKRATRSIQSRVRRPWPLHRRARLRGAEKSFR